MVRYPPYEKLSGPFSFKHRELFQDFTSGDYVYLLNQMLLAPPEKQLRAQRLKASNQVHAAAAKAAAQTGEGEIKFEAEDALEADANEAGPLAGRGCGFDVNRLSASKEGEDALVLEFFALHDPAPLKALEDKWMPLDWPWRVPCDDIMEYFGKEVAFYFAFLTHLTTGFMVLAVLGVGAEILAIYSLVALRWEAMYIESVSAVVSVCFFGVKPALFSMHVSR